MEGSAVDICRPFPYTVLVVVGSLRFQLTTKNEIGTPFRGSLSHFFRRGYFATAPFIAPLRCANASLPIFSTFCSFNAGFPRLCAVKARKRAAALAYILVQQPHGFLGNLACAGPLCRLKAPLGLSLLRNYGILISEENEKSEPFSYRKKVRIFIVWCDGRDSNHRPTDS